MIYLITAILFGSLFAILFKIFQRNGIDALQAIGINYVVAFALGSLGSLTQGFSTTGMASWILPAMGAGLFMMGSFVTMNMTTRSHGIAIATIAAMTTRSHGIAIATIAARVAFVVPVLCAFLFLHGDEPRWLASALVIASLLLIFHHRQEINTSTRNLLNPIPVFICYGMANFLLKLSQQIVAQNGGDNAELSLVTGVAFLSALLFTVIYYMMQPRSSRQPLRWNNVVAGIVLGVVNMGCTFFLLKSLMTIDSSIFYPVYNITIVLIATLAGRFGFGERLTPLQYGGIAVAIAAIILFFV